jgi:hypothetical protein
MTPLNAPWNVVFFERHPDDDPEKTVPGMVYLNECPDNIQQEMFAILNAVADAPPPSFRNSQVWTAMHDDMAGWFEARKKGQKLLYRVFCLVERSGKGLPGPSVVVITGMTKKNETAFSDEDYARVRALGEEYKGRTPRSIAR